MVSALLSAQGATRSNGGRLAAYRRAPIQFRLAIEKRKGYKGAAANGTAKKSGAKSKRDANPKRTKSVKAWYVSKGGK